MSRYIRTAGSSGGGLVIVMAMFALSFAVEFPLQWESAA